jgi:hypothetical protein
VVEQDIDHGRHQHRGGDAVFGDGVDNPLGIEVREHVQRTPSQEGRHEERRAGVAEGGAAEETQLVGPLPLGHLDGGHGGHAPARPDHAFRLAGGPARVGDRVRRFRVGWLDRPQLAGSELGRLAGQVRRMVGRGEGDDPLQARCLLLQCHGPFLVGRGVIEQRFDPGVLEDVGVVV